MQAGAKYLHTGASVADAQDFIKRYQVRPAVVH